MRVRYGLLKEYLQEAVLSTRVTSPSAPTDPDATVPGHLPNELPASAAIEETDERYEGDGLGNGMPDPKSGEDNIKLSDHLRGDEDKTSLGTPPEEMPSKSFYGESLEIRRLNREIRRFLLQEYPAGAGMVDPTKPPTGFYTDFDMKRDHHDGDDIHGFWYASPGRTPGADGDPKRGSDPYVQLGFHSPKGPHDWTTPPAASGEEGIAARRAPEEWTLNAGSDTSSVLGANNARPSSSGVGSEDGSEEDEEGEGLPGELPEEGEDDEPGRGGPGDRQD